MRKCGSSEDIDGIQLMMKTFGAKEVVNVNWSNWTCLHHAAQNGQPNNIGKEKKRESKIKKP